MFFIILLLLERHTVEWETLCSHIPLRGKIVGILDLSAEELEIIAAIAALVSNSIEQQGESEAPISTF